MQFGKTVAVRHMRPHNCDSMPLTLNKGHCVTPWQKQKGAKLVSTIKKGAVELISHC